MLNSPRAVANLLGLDAHLIQQRQVEIRHRCTAFVLNMPTGFETAIAASEQERGQILVRMSIPITQPAAI
jgi:hypothetical protein